MLKYIYSAAILLIGLCIGLLWNHFFMKQADCHGLSCYTAQNYNLSELVEQPRDLFLNHRNALQLLGGDKNSTTFDHWEPLLNRTTQKAKKHFPLNYRHKSCAVLGNSAKVIGREQGSFIDSHEAVFRINKGPVIGYENDVGSRTTYRVQWSDFRVPDGEDTISIFHLHGSRQNYLKQYIQWVSYMSAIVQKNKTLQKQYRERTMFFKARLPHDFLIVNYWVMSNAANLWFGEEVPFGSPKKELLTSGELTVALALHMCDQVNLFGMSTRKDANRCYYYDDSRTKCRPIGSYIKQFEWLDTLIREGVLKSY